MKKLLFVLIILLPILSCKTTNVSSSNTASKPASDTALQGDSMKAPVKP